jgi:hypothetical protein
MQTQEALIVQKLLVEMLDATGLEEEASEIGNMDPKSRKFVGISTSLLRKIGSDISGSENPYIQDICFWAEAMIWAGWKKDSKSFSDYKERLRNVLLSFGERQPH